MKKSFSLLAVIALIASVFTFGFSTASSAASVSVGTLTYRGGLLAGDDVWVTASGTSGGAALSYQWFNNSSPIDGATTNRITLTADDLGDTIYVEVTAARVGFDSQIVEGKNLVVGELNVLTEPKLVDRTLATTQLIEIADSVVFPTPDDTTYDWYINDELHLSDGKFQHIIHAADLGQVFSAKVTYAKTGYDSLVADTDSTEPITGLFGDSLTPEISGIPGVGQTVTAQAFDDGAPEFAATYQWFLAGKKISRATDANYKIAKKDAGKKLSVKVTYTAPEFPTRTFNVLAAAKVLTKKTKLTFFNSAYDAFVDCETDSARQECARGMNTYSGQVMLTSSRANDPITGDPQWATATFRIKYNVDPTKIVAWRVHQRGNDGIKDSTIQIQCGNDHDRITTVEGFYWVGPWCVPSGSTYGYWQVRLSARDAQVYALKAYLEIQYFG